MSTTTITMITAQLNVVHRITSSGIVNELVRSTVIHGCPAGAVPGFTVEALQLIIEADPPPGPIIEAEDQDGNEVHISIK